MKGIETELSSLQKRTLELEGLLADQEQSHARRILELTSRHRQVGYKILNFTNTVFKHASSWRKRSREQICTKEGQYNSTSPGAFVLLKGSLSLSAGHESVLVASFPHTSHLQAKIRNGFLEV